MKAHGRGCCRIKGSIRVAITRVPRHDLQRIARGTPTLRPLPVVELENRPSRTLSLLPGEDRGRRRRGHPNGPCSDESSCPMATLKNSIPGFDQVAIREARFSEWLRFQSLISD